MTWLPESFKAWASSSGFLSLALNEVLNERDTRLSAVPSTARLKTGLIAVIQKLRDRRENSEAGAILIAPSREAEETALRLAVALCADSPLRVVATTGVRDTAGFTKLFEDRVDLLITNPKSLEKVFDKGFASPEHFRTLFVDGTEWHEIMGETPLIASLCERLPAARQIILTGPVGQESVEAPLTELLHAPAFCRAPDEAARSTPPKERVILLPEDRLAECLKTESERTPVLYVVTTPTESTRLVNLLKEGDIAPKRATTTQSDSARETLLLKFAAKRIDHLVMPHALLGELEEGSVARLIQTNVEGGPQAYLEHLSLVSDGEGELITIVTPDTLPLFEKLLCTAEKRLTLENPYGVKEPRTVIGQLIRREKLTIRTNFTKDAATTETDTTDASSDTRENDRPQGRRFDRKKPFKKNTRAKKPYRNPRPTDEAADTTETREDAPKKKSFKERRFNKKKPFRQHRHDDQAQPKEQTDTKALVAETTEPTTLPQPNADATGETSTKPTGKSYRRKPKKFVPKKKFEAEAATDARPETTDNRPPQEKKPFEKKRFQKKRPKTQTPRRQESEWDEDNFGNSIHYQPKRQNLRGLRSDQTIHWEPTDPYHPASQALSLPQMMPDEVRPGSKGGFNRGRRNNFRRKRDGER